MPEEARYNYQAVYQRCSTGVFEIDGFSSFPCAVRTNPARLNYHVLYICHHSRAEPAGSKSSPFEQTETRVQQPHTLTALRVRDGATFS